MFDYTIGALNKILDDFKKIARGVNIGAQIVSILYLIYALIASVGFTILNVILLVLTVSYFVFFLVMEFSKGNKITKKRVKSIYQWSKRGIKLLVICLTAYGLVFVTKEFSPLSLVLFLCMVLGFALDILFYFLVKFLTAEVELLKVGVQKDWAEIKKPVQSVGNFFKKLSGKEVEPEPALTAKEQRLHDILEEQAAAVQLRREEKKNEKKQRKLEEKSQRKQKKRNQADAALLPATTQDNEE